MTWSIIARDPATGELGIAVATRFFAVGALVPHIDPGAGAVATQALVNPYLGIDGVALLRQGVAAEDALARLLAADPGRDSRQIHLMDRAGATARHTGKSCVDWCGHLARQGITVAGNMLAGPQVIEATAYAFLAARGKPLAERFLAALDAGEAAGGDKRGKQSAAIRIHRGEAWPALDIRVDDHADPLRELRRIYERSFERWQAFRDFLPTRANPAGVTDRARIDAAIAAAQAKAQATQ
jgi:uncharacterized Ntn-hydrolase superfamily protein